jgi:hypothetical protein
VITQKDMREAVKMPEDFAYFGDLPIGDTWSLGPVILTRDSDLLTESNAQALKNSLEEIPEFEGEYAIESMNHWAVGWTEHLCFHVFEYDGDLMVPTEIFKWIKKWFEALEDYPVADEEDWSRREVEATLENITNEGIHLVRECTEGWESKVYSWLWDNDQYSVESHDGGGGYPSDSAIRKALKALNMLDPEYDEEME